MPSKRPSTTPLEAASGGKKSKGSPAASGHKKKVAGTGLKFPLGNTATSCSEKLFAWLIHPVTVEQFFEEYWEKKPLHVKRPDARDYYSGVWTKAMAEKTLAKHECRFGESVNFARVEDGAKVMHNGEEGEKATVEYMQERFEEGVSCQFMQPQRFSKPCHALMERLENYFGTLWGANSYLTPANSVGFAPHYDDVEVFMLQTEGSKRWRLYDSPDDDGPLPMDYSRDYTEEELALPYFDEVIEQGDLLYIPRGTVHFGCVSPGGYSHHLTVSTYYHNSWGELLQNLLIPGALAKAMKEDVAFREGVPVNWMRYMGRLMAPVTVETAAREAGEDEDNASDDDATAEEEDDSSMAVEEEVEKVARVPPQGETQAEPEALMRARKAFKGHVKELIAKLSEYVDEDDAADQTAVDFIALRTPPAPRAGETKTHGPSPAAQGNLLVRWRNPAWVRVAVESDVETMESTTLIFHCADNKMSQHMMSDDASKRTPGTLEISGVDKVAALSEMYRVWPDWVDMQKLGQGLTTSLWEEGVVQTKAPPEGM
ncbi:hypothetical protein FOZ61_004387 [Perkinsus olseni]|uniref:Bifunctional lysine-specific demethylase and histidyl-hydroxylase n=1 Tax=Perkinsus olseni TaxID=32597 RepID=A0A7J6MCQ0_PEROL|nr:hypothetical protein FOZ61_004387 [Perkinsus olseni]KAF4674645.1 hypothetical protein FOL46_004432 [Perkinsus olseni]